jgi:hypothetical protein
VTRTALNRLAPTGYDRLVLPLLLGLTIAVCFTFRDYGISNDEEVQNVYGRLLLAFYKSGFSDWSVFHYKNLFLYGGLFDLVAALIDPLMSFGEYEERHLLSGLIGVAGVAGAWRLARYLGGPRAGWLAAVMLASAGVWFGAMFNHTKDIPFAAAMTWWLYYTCRFVDELPKPRAGTVLLLGLTAGLAFGLRIMAALGVVYLLLGIAAYLIVMAREESRADVMGDLRRIALRLLPAGLLAYALMALFWPWAVLSPFNPIKALSEFRQFTFEIDDIVAGIKCKMYAPPAHYLPTYLAIKIPEAVVFGLAALGLAGWYERRRLLALDRRTQVRFALLVAAAFLPVIYNVIGRPPIYNGLRHYMFVIPPMVVLAAIGIDRLLARTADSVIARRGALTAVTALIGWSVVSTATLHPHQYVYYNAFVGGLPGANDRYVMDYWANTTRELALALNDIVAADNQRRGVRRAYSVALCAESISAEAYLAPTLYLTKDWWRADFFIAPTHMGCDEHLDGEVIYDVTRDGVVLGVLKDRRLRVWR